MRTHQRLEAQEKRPFVEHLYELRRRIYYILISVLFWGSVTYAVQQKVVGYLLRPSHGQNFIYTTPGGGIDFLFRICIYSGLVLSLPVIIYNVLGFIEPIISSSSRRFIILASSISGILAIAGLTFGYYLGLPAALHFLLHQFKTAQIRPLVTIQSYLAFVIVYMVGSALLFQMPLILVCINRIKPLQPKKLLHFERWVILGAFIISGLMNPTPNLISQGIIIIPFIIMYQVGILLIYLINRSNKQTISSDDVFEYPPQEPTISAEPVQPGPQLPPEPQPMHSLQTQRQTQSYVSRPTQRTAPQPTQRRLITDVPKKRKLPPKGQFMDFIPRPHSPEKPQEA